MSWLFSGIVQLQCKNPCIVNAADNNMMLKPLPFQFLCLAIVLKVSCDLGQKFESLVVSVAT